MTPEDYDKCFRPRRQPAQAIYDAFQQEAILRDTRPVEAWTHAETEAVWKAARDQAEMHGLRVPTIEEVREAEQMARGSVDYGSKWAYYVERRMRAETAAKTPDQPV